MKIKKRFISCTLAVLMLFSALPLSGFTVPAETSSESQTTILTETPSLGASFQPGDTGNQTDLSEGNSEASSDQPEAVDEPAPENTKEPAPTDQGYPADIPEQLHALSLSQTITSFEAANPVTEINCKTGDAVSWEKLPSSLPAVVTLNETVLHFTQAIPSDSKNYIAPDNAEELYAADTLVVYVFQNGEATEYRVYGNADGTDGWFSCDASGIINGIVKDVPISWDTSSVSTETAGSYSLTGSVDGYTINCLQPAASVTVAPKSGDQNIATHSLFWISGCGDWTITGDLLDISQKSTDNGHVNAICEINFSLGGEYAAEPGEIEIRIPAHTIMLRDGNVADWVIMPIPKAPTESGATGFNYTIDETTDEIVIRNYQKIEPSYFFRCQVNYRSTSGFSIADGYTKNDIQASFSVNTTQGTLTASSETLTLQIHSQIPKLSAYKYSKNKYERWREEWGPAPENSADYFYVLWTMQMKTADKDGTQPYTVKIQEDPGQYGTVVGWYAPATNSYTLENFTRGTIEDLSGITVMDEERGNKNRYIHIAVQYPRSMLTETDTITNTAHFTIEGYDSGSSTVSVDGTYRYTPPNTTPPSDTCNGDKGGSNNYSLIRLKAGEATASTYSISTISSAPNLTNDGQNEFTSVTEDGLLFINDEQLTSGDYEFTGFGFMKFEEKNYVIDDTGEYALITVDRTTYQPIYVYIKTLEHPDQWTSYGRVVTSTDLVWEGNDGTTRSAYGSNGVPLPPGTINIKLEHTGTNSYVWSHISLGVRINPTEHVLSQISENGDTVKISNISNHYHRDHGKNIISGTHLGLTSCPQKQKQTAIDLDMLNYGTTVRHEYVEETLRLPGKPYSSCIKKVVKTKSDVINSQEIITYEISFREYMSNFYGLTWEEAIKYELVPEQRNGVLYDLLPMGAIIDPDSIDARNYANNAHYSGTAVGCTLELIENWRDSGRTMAKINVTVPEGMQNYDSKRKTNLSSGFIVRFDVIYPWESIGNFGNELYNSAAYMSLDGELGQGCKDTGGYLSDAVYFEDLNTDGNPPDTLANFLYASCKNTLNTVVAAELGFRKSVKAASDTKYEEFAAVSATESYTYQLRFANNVNIYTGNVVIYDVLEQAYGNNAYWQGSLVGIDTAQVRQKGIDPVIYYSSYQGFTNLAVDTTLADLDNASIWSRVKPSNPQDITAIAIDLRFKTDGTEYIFSPNEIAVCYVSMSPPENYADYVDDPSTPESEAVFAYNSAYLQSTTALSPGSAGTTDIKECKATTVSLTAPQISISKSSDPVSGTESMPTVVTNGQTLTYYLEIANTGKTSAITDISVQDVIPEGLLIQANEIKYRFGYANYAMVADSSRVNAEVNAQNVSILIDSLAAGERVSLMIPTIVSNETQAGCLYENTARIQSLNGKNIVIVSNTTWHKTQVVYDYTLPETGGTGTFPFVMFGGVLIVASLLLEHQNRLKRKNRQNRICACREQTEA